MALTGTVSTMAIHGASSRSVMPQKWYFHVTNEPVLQTIIQCPPHCCIKLYTLLALAAYYLPKLKL